MRWKSRLSKSRQVLTLLTLALALIAGLIWWAAPSAGAGGRPGAPEVRTRSLALGAKLRVTRPAASAAAPSSDQPNVRALDPGMPFTMLGVVCDPPVTDGDVVVRLRVSDDGQTWSRWYEVPLERASEAQGGGEAFTEAIWTGPGRQVQVAAAAVDGDAPVALANVRLVALDTQPPASVVGRAADVVLRRLAGLAGLLHATSPAYAATTEPRIVTRAQWGADESLRDGEPSLAPVKMAFIHHTAGGNSYSQDQAPGVVRGILEYHTQSLGWSDIGYNFLVDRFGTIYEGRYGGVREGPIGAQTYGFNTGSTGISVIGDYMSSAPPAAALNALEKLLAWKLELHGIDPEGTATMTCGGTDKYQTGATVKFPTIAAHRDANYTDCPGDAFYAKLPAIRKAVAAVMGGDPPEAQPLPKWKVALSRAPASLARDTRVALTGRVTTAAGKAAAGSVVLQKRPASGGAWTDWQTLPLAADGSFAATARMTVVQTSQVRARMAAGAGSATGFSLTRKVTVTKPAEQLPPPVSASPAKWAVTLTVAPQRLPVNLRIALTGTVRGTGAAMGTVAIQKRPASGGVWTDWRTLPLAADGSFAATVRMTVVQASHLRARMAHDAANAKGCSAASRVTIVK